MRSKLNVVKQTVVYLVTQAESSQNLCVMIIFLNLCVRVCISIYQVAGMWDGFSQYSRIIYDYTNIHDCIVMDARIVIDYSIEAS